MPALARSQPLTGGRLAAVIGGSLALLLSVLLMLAGAGLLWADAQKDDDGYYTSDSERVAASTYALATDDLDVDGVPGGEHLYGKLRLKVRERANEPVFVGIARSRDVATYLAGTAHTRLTDVEFDPFDPAYRDSAGSARPARPDTQDIWAASAQGAGTQSLTWDVKDGRWSVVVMNADGSKGIDASVSAAASVPFVGKLG